jgi:AraC-like DNA-binding protein
MSFFSEREINKQGRKILYDIFKNSHERGYIMQKAHIHSYFELIYVTHGEAAVICNSSERYRLKEGDVILIPPSVIHSAHIPSDSPFPEGKTVTVKFSAQLLLPLANTASDIQYLINSERRFDKCIHLKGSSPTAKEIASLMSSALAEFTDKKPCYELALRGYISLLYSLLVRAHTGENHKNESHTVISMKNAEHLCDALRYIEENYRNPLSMQQVADACGISYTQLTYLFSKCFVKGFSEYLLELRINHAEKLLLQTNKSITDIALDCGFDNASYFAKKFKAVTYMTPKEFRAKHLSSSADIAP